MNLDLNNLKKNWFLPIIAIAFFLQSGTWTMDFALDVLIASLLWTIVAMNTKDLHELCRLDNVVLKVLAALSSIGVCLGSRTDRYKAWLYRYSVLDLRDVSFKVPVWAEIVVFLLGSIFVYILIAAFWKALWKIVTETNLFGDVRKYEWITYGIVLFAYIVLAVLCYSKSNFIYGTNYDGDVLFSSDSNCLYKSNVWVTLANSENDIRQPLFSVFAIPFCGLPYVITEVFCIPESVKAILTDIPQIFLLVLGNFILCKLINLKPQYRVVVMTLLSMCYTSLVFSIMFEQYVVVYFYLMLCIWTRIKLNRHNDYLLTATTGTLVTGCVLIPLLNSTPVKEFKKWVLSISKSVMMFVVFIGLFIRTDVILKIFQNMNQLSQFSKYSLSLKQKLMQYTVFVQSYFIAPICKPLSEWDKTPTWQLDFNLSFSVIGIVIALIAILSFVINRKDKLVQLSGVWIVFSFLITVIVGWGTVENGLILYSLYFGWAFFVLVIKFIMKLNEKLNKPVIFISSVIVLGVLFFVFNIKSLVEMISFAMEFYPI